MRVVIYSKDVETITGLTPRTARHILGQVRKHFKKQKHLFVTVEEFCTYKGLSEDKILAIINR